MGFRINTNIAAMNSHRSAMQTNAGLDKSLASLSSGLRINTAADDASGMTIADSLRSQAQGLGQAINNANDGVAVVQTADGALDEYINIINSVRTKSIQAASDGQNADSRAAIQSDIDRLLQAADGIASQTQFNGQKLLDGSFTNKSFHIGAYAGETASLSVGSVKTDSVGDISAVKGSSFREPIVLADNMTETADGYALQANQLTVNGTDISASISALSPNSLTEASSIAKAITDATGILAKSTTVLSGAAVTGGTIDAAHSLKINGVAIADTTVLAGDSNGALSSAINAITSQTGVTAAVVDGSLSLTSKDGSNISVGGTSTVSASQVDTLSIPTAATAEAGDIFTVDVNGTTISHTVANGEAMTDVLSGLSSKINLDPTIGALLTASDATGDLVLTGLTDTVTFTTTSGITNLANVDSATKTSDSGTSSNQKIAAIASYNSGSIVSDSDAAYVDGDTITFTDGISKSWTVEVGPGGSDGIVAGDSIDDIMAAMAVKINAEGTYAAAYDATTNSLTVPAAATAAGFDGQLTATGFAITQADGVASNGTAVVAGAVADYTANVTETAVATGGETISWTDGTGNTYTSDAATAGDTAESLMTNLTAKIDLGGIYNASYTLGGGAGSFTVESNTQEAIAGYTPALTDSAGVVDLVSEATTTSGTTPVPATAATFTSFKLEAGSTFPPADTDVFTWTDGVTTATATIGAAGGDGLTTASSFEDIMVKLASKIQAEAAVGTASYDTAAQKLTVTAAATGVIAGYNPQITSTTATDIVGLSATGGYSNEGTAGVSATGTFTYAAGTSALDAGDTVEFDVSDGTNTITASYTTLAGDTTATILAGLNANLTLQAATVTGAAMFGTNSITSTVDAATGTINITAGGKTGEAMTVTDQTVDSGVNADAALNLNSATATADTGSYDITGLSDKLTNQSSTASVASFTSTSLDVVTLLKGDLVINGKDMAGIYGNSTTAGAAANDLEAVIQSISGMADSNISAGGIINLVVNNGDDLNIAGVKSVDTFKLTEGVFNESQTGLVEILSEKDVQIGGTSADIFGFTTGNFTPTSTGVSLESIDVTSRESAEQAILIADSALKQLDATRSDLGSVQNQLESTIRNISVTQVNVTSAESQIRDVDFAAESANFAKLNILAQSGSYAMSQANAVQQNVMRLLQ